MIRMSRAAAAESATAAGCGTGDLWMLVLLTRLFTGKFEMDIIGIGTDIVEIARLQKVIDSHGKHFLERVYTECELELLADRKNSITFLAGRWAAKEAAAKALGCGIGEKCNFTDINISSNASGQPEMSFSGAAAKEAGRLGVTGIKLSISHEANYAVATVLLVK